MNREKYIYAGNRSTVLRRMISLGLDVQHVLPTAGSWLEREMPELGLPYTPVASKKKAIDVLGSQKFDVFVSTGFRFILPITQLQGVHQHAKFVNIHPSFLPDLRGADPIPGAVLFGRDSGVTCHLMDDGIDTGAIVAQCKIPYFDGLDSKLLYKLCFKLEPDVFEMGLGKGFKPELADNKIEHFETIYYSAKADDACFNQHDNAPELIRRARAFNTSKRGFHFKVGTQYFKSFDALQLPAAYLYENVAVKDGMWTVVDTYEDCLILKQKKFIIKLSQVLPLPEGWMIGKSLEKPISN